MGPFIVFEGGEGSGKSSQSVRLGDLLRDHGVDAINTRDPGGTIGAEEIRGLLVSGAVDRWSRPTEMLLYTAARTEHVERVIGPHLDAGRMVISDRFIDSTLAYQANDDLARETTALSLHRSFCRNLVPDLTILLDIDPVAGLARSKRRLNAEASAEGRFEAMDIAFHQRIREVFQRLARQSPERYFVVDATLPKDEIFALILAEVIRRFNIEPLPQVA